MKITWTWKRFEALSGEEVHALLALRQRIFVVEQRCAYQDADELDRCARHLMGRCEAGRLAAYARVVPPAGRDAPPSLGRIVVREDLRGLGMGREVLRRCLAHCRRRYPRRDIRMSAQTHLVDFYRGFGFDTVGEPYDDEGVAHIEMVLPGRALERPPLQGALSGEPPAPRSAGD